MSIENTGFRYNFNKNYICHFVYCAELFYNVRLNGEEAKFVRDFDSLGDR